MNKLASILFLQKMDLPTINPRIIKESSEKGIRKAVDSFYYNNSLGWVMRCGEWPDENAKIERNLPWGKASDKEDLVKRIMEMQKEVSGKYFVFCHEAFDLIRGGVMLIEGNNVIIEAAHGNDRELSAMFRGYRSPEQSIIFNPGMLSYKKSGKEVLTVNDLYEMRSVERRLDWKELNAVSDPVLIEFSRLRDESLYVHDLSIA
jgi:hypothetical protein